MGPDADPIWSSSANNRHKRHIFHLLKFFVLRGHNIPRTRSITVEFSVLVRELTPFEHLVCEHLCDGMTNAAIAKATTKTEKIIENTVSRAALAFSIKTSKDINVRVLLALAYRSYFGDKAFDKLGIACRHQKISPAGERICTQHDEIAGNPK
ncbi:MAG: hypothetical protein RLY62_563 [Actinomycetota bacterium]